MLNVKQQAGETAQTSLTMAFMLETAICKGIHAESKKAVLEMKFYSWLVVYFNGNTSSWKFVLSQHP